MEFTEYVIEASVSVRRRRDYYNSETIAEVSAKETLTLTERSVGDNLADIATEVLSKAQTALQIKHRAEREIRALEAGPEIIGE